ncbi:MAG TPA: threonine synthase [Woeseiaceae bacterium]|nr:threonine synthase [Woeseiaceae bacterium]
MKYVSTRGGEAVSLDQAIAAGIAKDGGLFVPDPVPAFALKDFEDATTIHEVAQVLLGPFFEGSALAPHLGAIIGETFSFPIPLTKLSVATGDLHMLELFHGPTAAFKDIGAGFLAACLSRLQRDQSVPLTILVATSGDTGGAVAAAFNERPGMRVVVLFPEGRVSQRQARQLTCWGDNVLSLAVHGSFDDCQALVKEAMANADLNARHRFSSANSINIGRLLPQCTYYAHASLARYRESGQKPSFIVPTGNLGNGLALMLCKQMGLPVADVILATNENRVIGDYLEEGEWLPTESKPTLASAMDVGNPSNMERVLALFGDAASLHRLIRAVSVSDQHIEEEIREGNTDFGFAICPHTATACHVYRHLSDEERRMKNWIVVATAHPAKFEQIVEPLTGHLLDLPDSLRAILDRPVHSVSIGPDLASFEMALEDRFGLDARSSAGDK